MTADRDFRPLFLFSIPRSGSTLVQRVLAGHSEISTLAEPWILLPLFYALRSEGINTEYNQQTAVKGISDFLHKMEGGTEAYRKAVGSLAYDLYSQHMEKHPGKYFLDKTPRYYHIAGEIFDTFDQAKCIFLWRNPLACAASMIQTWTGGRFEIHKFHHDLDIGLSSLVDVYSGGEHDTLSLRYEDFVENTNRELEKVWNFLELGSEPSVLETFGSNELQGIMGDPKRGERSTVTGESMHSWVHTMNSPVRRWWCRRYLDRVGQHRLHAMGYDREQLLQELRSVPLSLSRLPADLYVILKVSLRKMIHSIFTQ